MHNARYDEPFGKRLKKLTPKKMFRRLPKDNICENVLNEICQIHLFFLLSK